MCTDPQTILDNGKIKQFMGGKVDGVIGQLTGAFTTRGAGGAEPLKRSVCGVLCVAQCRHTLA